MTCTCHVGKNEQNLPVNTRRLLCPCDCLDMFFPFFFDELDDTRYKDAAKCQCLDAKA